MRQTRTLALKVEYEDTQTNLSQIIAALQRFLRQATHAQSAEDPTTPEVKLGALRPIQIRAVSSVVEEPTGRVGSESRRENGYTQQG